MYVAVVVVYLLILIGVGAFKARKIRSQADFSLAGRGMGSFVLVGTLLATWIGTGSIFGNAEETYQVGMPAVLIPLAGGLGILALYFLAARVRQFGQFTIQDILEARFGVGARIMGTITLFMAYVIIVSYQYRAGSAIVARLVPGISYELSVILVALFVILYTVLAGMLSVAYTDVANGLMMIVGMGCALPLLLSQAGGWDVALGTLTTSQQSVFGHYSVTHLLSILLPAFLLIVGDANMYQRFFSAKDPATAKKSAAWMFVGTVLMEWAIIFTALIGAALVAQGKITAPENAGHIIVHLAFDAMPPLLGSMLIATVVAVIVSTADSYLLAPSTSIVRDVYQRFMAPNADETRVVFVGRLVVVALGLIALALAFTSKEFFSVSLFAYTLYGASITPALMAAFFWKRATAKGAFWAMVSGVVTAIVWKAFLAQHFADWNLDAVIPATVVNILVLIFVSLATKPEALEKQNAV